MNMKSMMLCIGLLMCSSASAITVHDPIDYVYDVLTEKNGAEQVLKLLQVINELQRNYQELVYIKEKVTGIRGFHDFMNDAFIYQEVRRYIPDEWDAVLDEIDDFHIGRGGQWRYKAVLEKLQDIYRIPDSTIVFQNGEYTERDEIYDRERKNAYAWTAMGEASYDRTIDRLVQTEAMIDSLSSTEDLKDSVDAQVRTTAVVAEFSAENSRLLSQLVAAQGQSALNKVSRQAHINRVTARTKLAWPEPEEISR